MEKCYVMLGICKAPGYSIQSAPALDSNLQSLNEMRGIHMNEIYQENGIKYVLQISEYFVKVDKTDRETNEKIRIKKRSKL